MITNKSKNSKRANMERWLAELTEQQEQLTDELLAATTIVQRYQSMLEKTTDDRIRITKALAELDHAAKEKKRARKVKKV